MAKKTPTSSFTPVRLSEYISAAPWTSEKVGDFHEICPKPCNFISNRAKYWSFCFEI